MEAKSCDTKVLIAIFLVGPIISLIITIVTWVVTNGAALDQLKISKAKTDECLAVEKILKSSRDADTTKTNEITGSQASSALSKAIADAQNQLDTLKKSNADQQSDLNKINSDLEVKKKQLADTQALVQARKEDAEKVSDAFKFSLNTLNNATNRFNSAVGSKDPQQILAAAKEAYNAAKESQQSLQTEIASLEKMRASMLLLQAASEKDITAAQVMFNALTAQVNLRQAETTQRAADAAKAVSTLTDADPSEIMKDTLENLKQQLENVNNAVNSINKQNDALTDQAASLRTLQASLESQLKTSDEQEKSSAQALEAINNRAKQLTSDVQAVKDKLDAASKLTVNSSATVAAILDSKQTPEDIQAKIDAVTKEIENTKAEKALLEKQIINVTKIKTALEAAFLEADKSLGQTNTELTAMNEKVDALAESLKKTRREIATQTKKKEEALDDANKKKEALDIIGGQIDKAREYYKTLQKTKNAITSEMAIITAKINRVGGSYDTVTENQKVLTARIAKLQEESEISAEKLSKSVSELKAETLAGQPVQELLKTAENSLREATEYKDKLDAEKTELTNTQEGLKRQLDEASTKITNAEKRTKELEFEFYKLNNTFTRNVSNISQMNDTLKNTDNSEAALKILTKQYDEAKAAKITLENEAKNLQMQKDALESQISGLPDQNKAKLARLASKAKELTDSLSKLQQDLVDARKKASTIQLQNKDVSSVLSDLQSQLWIVQTQKGKLDRVISVDTMQKNIAQSKMWEIRYCTLLKGKSTQGNGTLDPMDVANRTHLWPYSTTAYASRNSRVTSIAPWFGVCPFPPGLQNCDFTCGNSAISNPTYVESGSNISFCLNMDPNDASMVMVFQRPVSYVRSIFAQGVLEPIIPSNTAKTGTIDRTGNHTATIFLCAAENADDMTKWYSVKRRRYPPSSNLASFDPSKGTDYIEIKGRIFDEWFAHPEASDVVLGANITDGCIQGDVRLNVRISICSGHVQISFAALDGKTFSFIKGGSGTEDSRKIVIGSAWQPISSAMCVSAGFLRGFSDMSSAPWLGGFALEDSPTSVSSQNVNTTSFAQFSAVQVNSSENCDINFFAQ